MSWHKGWLLVAGLLFCLGCQNNGNYDLMERELRLQEDRIYQLEDELDRKCQLLAAIEQENRKLQQSLDNNSTRLKLSAPKTTEPSTSGTVPNGSPLVPPKVEIDLPAPGTGAPGVSPPAASPLDRRTNPFPPDTSPPAAPSAAPSSDSLPALDSPQLNLTRPTPAEAAPLPEPSAAPAPRSLLDRSRETWQPAAEPVDETVTQQSPPPTTNRLPPVQARRPAWSPYR